MLLKKYLINADEYLKIMQNDRKSVVLDLRDASLYEKIHLPTAQSGRKLFNNFSVSLKTEEEKKHF